MQKKQTLATSVVKKLQDAGHIAYFAGGWVRDFLMNHPSDDIDIATSASVQEVQNIFSKTIPVGVAFGIVIVVEQEEHFEVATFRKDRGYVDGRRPSGIDPATPEEDAQRRDFTINGMFYDPLSKVLIDFVGGQKDIKKKVIRAIGNPHERFLEDRLRMMRAVRYSTRFNFPIQSKTVEAILAHAEQLLPSVAMERVWQEFKKMSQFAHFDEGLVALHQLRLLPTIFPDLKDVPIQEIKKRVSTIKLLPKTIPTIAELLELFPSHSLEKLLSLCEQLKLSKKEKEFVYFYHHGISLLNMPLEWQENLENIEWARFYANPDAESCLLIAAAHVEEKERPDFWNRHQKKQKLLKIAVERIKTQHPLIRAEDLMKEGILPGISIGKLLNEAERISVNLNIDERERVLIELKKSPLWQEIKKNVK